MELSNSDIARFWKYVDRRGEDEYWPWTGAKSAGYGSLTTGSKRTRRFKLVSSRVAFLLATGIDPAHLMVCHTCDNRACCNPRHLFLGTALDNTRDMLAKGRGIEGRRRDSGKLTDQNVHEILELIAAGWSHSRIAAKFGVNKATISYIRNGKLFPSLLKRA